MESGNSSPTDVARAVKAVCEYFGIPLVDGFVKESQTEIRDEKGVKTMLRELVITKKEVNFDSKVYEDLEILAKNTNRTVNDIVDVMAADFLKENKLYFVSQILLDNLRDFLDGDAEADSCRVANIEIDVADESKEGNIAYKLHCMHKDLRGAVIQNFERTYEDIEDLENELEEIACMYIDRDHPDVKNYLKHRMDYR